MTAYDRRQTRRRQEDRAPKGETLPAIIAPAPAKARPAQTDGARYAAQLLGQGGEKRGLRGGPPVLEAANSAYLSAEFSGPDDRRPAKGRLGGKAV